MNIIENDVYVAYQGSSDVYIAMDEYSIAQISSGFLVESNNTVFGTNGFQQKALLKTDFQWKMQELKVTIDSVGLAMYASVNDGKLYLQQNKKDASFEKIIDLQHDNFFFMYSGALVIPMVWLRGFDFCNYEKVTCQMIPMGFAEIKQLSEDIVSSKLSRDFSLLMYMQNFTDIIKIQTDISGKLISLHSEVNKITVKIKSM